MMMIWLSVAWEVTANRVPMTIPEGFELEPVEAGSHPAPDVPTQQKADIYDEPEVHFKTVDECAIEVRMWLLGIWYFVFRVDQKMFWEGWAGEGAINFLGEGGWCITMQVFTFEVHQI